jgi:aconitate hydratase
MQHQTGALRPRVADLRAFAGDKLARLPFLSRIVLENLLRRSPAVAAEVGPAWLAKGFSDAEVPFYPSRVLMHDTTCGPALVDLAAGRSALAAAGGDPRLLNPVLPVDVSTDHSLAVDAFGAPEARARNQARELERNAERYEFMKWATGAMSNLTVHPPGSGIMHTINLERLATVTRLQEVDGETWAAPDTLVGTDSHTPMVNALGVLAWGVGGLEAESVMLGMPVVMRAPEVVGVRLTGALPEGVLATDLALSVTAILRGAGMEGRFVEFFGPGVTTLSVGDRAVVANMAPEYGAATGYFPIDEATIAYLQGTGRSDAHAAFVRAYAKEQGLWFDPAAEPRYAQVIDIDLRSIALCLAGPRRPQDRLSPAEAPAAVRSLREAEPQRAPVAIAAITSCTNTSDPRLLVAAGLLARKARKLGLKPPAHVKTSLAPGSPTAERYLKRAGLLDDLDALGFSIVGYGCTTCIGNSGPLLPQMIDALEDPAVLPVAVLSGNRNFPGRVHPDLEAAFLASPPMVIAYALAGDVDRDLLQSPVAWTADGSPILLADLWPTGAEIDATLAAAGRVEDYDEAYGEATASEAWRALAAPEGVLYPWRETSTYLRPPPFVTVTAETRLGRYLADPLIVLGDDITTDHISPAGAIRSDSEAGRHLVGRGAAGDDLNVFASRRGNWEVMVRGLFTNRAVRNLLASGLKAGETVHGPSGEVLSLWDAANRYRDEGRSVVIVAGERYGMGSSRDWAAKGVALLGARAVLAASFERIHRANLVNMGVLPLRLPAGIGPAALALEPLDRIEVDAAPGQVTPRGRAHVTIHRQDGRLERFEAIVDVETGLEIATLEAGGMIPMILQAKLRPAATAPAA